MVSRYLDGLKVDKFVEEGLSYEGEYWMVWRDGWWMDLSGCF